MDRRGDLIARPAKWEGRGEPPVVFLPKGQAHLQPGDHVLAKIASRNGGAYRAHVITRIDNRPKQFLAIYGGEGRLVPTDRRHRTEYVLPEDANAEVEKGSLVLAEQRRRGLPEVKIIKRFGPGDSPAAPSLIAIHGNEIPLEFPDEALREAACVGPVPVDDREDMRDVPLVTIDGEDARDFDDAVWAEQDSSPDNSGGWHVIVAISDVAWYVRPGTALDNCARERGNSVYFPDRVVPIVTGTAL